MPPGRVTPFCRPVWVLGTSSGKIISRCACRRSPRSDGHGPARMIRRSKHAGRVGPAAPVPHVERGDKMAAMKPRTGDGPLEVTKEGRGIVMRVPLEGGGRLVVEMTKDEANDLSEALKGATG